VVRKGSRAPLVERRFRRRGGEAERFAEGDLLLLFRRSGGQSEDDLEFITHNGAMIATGDFVVKFERYVDELRKGHPEAHRGAVRLKV